MNNTELKLINWQYLEWTKLTPAQLSIYQAEQYNDESCTLRYTKIPAVIKEFTEAVQSEHFNPANLQALAQKVKQVCLSAVSDNLEIMYRVGNGDSFKTCMVSLRVLMRIEIIAKKIMNGETASVVIKPYLIQNREYIDTELFFTSETQFKNDLVKLYKDQANTFFKTSSEACFQLLKFIHSLNIDSEKDLFAIAFELVKQSEYPTVVLEMVGYFKEWKHIFSAILIENKENLSWLIQKGMLDKLKKRLPEFLLQFEEQENAYFRTQKENQALKLELAENNVLAAARKLWADNNPNIEKKEIGDIEKKSIPRELLCPILDEAMIDPVVTEAGMMYERKAIELWLKDHNTDPMTRAVISKTLIPLHPIKSLIQKYL